MMKIRTFDRLIACMGASLLSFGGAARAADVAMDDGFRASAQGIVQLLGQRDATSALDRSRSLLSSADQPFEKYVAGQLLLEAAGRNGDLRAQRSALTEILESGAVTEGQMARLRSMAGQLSALLGDPRDATAQIRYANQLGLQTPESQFALADASFQLGDAAAATTALDQATALRASAGKPVPAQWFDRAAALSYKLKRPDLGLRWAGVRLAHSAGPQDWRAAVLSYLAVVPQPTAQQLDLYRLLAATGGLAAGRDYLAYASAAALEGQASEARAAIESGVRAGDLDVADGEARKLLASAPKKAKSPAKGKAAATAAAIAAADAAFAAAEFTVAAGAYHGLLDKDAGERDRILTRYGIALARSGDLNGARAALGQVPAGSWSAVATLWGAWVENRLKTPGVS